MKILISACLHGQPVRYDGQAKTLDHPHVARWREEGRLVAICPELAGGFDTPRLPAEIERGMSGGDVLAGRARVLDSAGADVTAAYVEGAKAALDSPGKPVASRHFSSTAARPAVRGRSMMAHFPARNTRARA